MYVKRTISFVGKHFVTSAVIRSKPGDFLFGYFRIVFFTSFGVTNLVGGP